MGINNEIAIIGMSFEFPGVIEPEGFYKSLLEKKILYTLNCKDAQNSSFIPAWGGVRDEYGFDYEFFRYSYKEACYIDPQHRLILMHCWHALENAGCANYKYRPITGIFASASINKYLHNNLINQINNDKEDEVLIGNTHDFLASRVAFKLNLKGPAINIQSGCSSALVSVHQARLSILTGQCDIALVAAVSLSAPNDHGYLYETDGIRSRNGQIRPFDSQSTGTVFTNGVAVIVLKKLEMALRDKDNVIGVISSSSVNNDGSDKANYTAPCSNQQAEVIKKALKIADILPQDYSFIETHGTGTNLGDAIEFEALKRVFADLPYANSCILQSVKANVGHLDTASSLAGIIKTALVLKNGKLPPQVNFKYPNNKIDFDNTPFCVNAEKTVELNGKEIYAGVTSLGIGGTNAHIVMKAPKNKNYHIDTEKNNANIVLLSGHTKNSLHKIKKQYLEFIKINQAVLHNISYSSIFGKAELKYRSAFVALNTEDLESQIKLNLDKDINDLKRSIVFLFPGQGSQYFKMGIDLFYSSETFRQILSELFDIINKLLKKDCFEILFGDEQEQKQLYETVNTQPIILAIEVALARYLMHCGIKPKALLGHSLGEYSAFVISGSLTFKKAAELVVKRAELMSNVPPGRMLSVVSDIKTVQAIKSENIDIAAINSSCLTTVSGSKQEIDNFSSACLKEGIMCQLLPTDKAFHSHLLDDILKQYYDFSKTIHFDRMLTPVVSNLYGRVLNDKDLNADYLVQQARKPVQFLSSIETIVNLYDPDFLEVGPGTTLQFLTKSIVHEQGKTKCSVLNTLPHPKDATTSLITILTCFAKLWEKGHDIAWDKVRDFSDRYRKIPLPSYPFNLERCCVEKKENALVSHIANTSENKLPLTYVKSWKQESYQACEQINLNNYEVIFLQNDSDINSIITSLQDNNLQSLLIYKCTESFDHSMFLLYLANACIDLDKKHKVSKIYFISSKATGFQADIDPEIATLQTQIKVVNQELAYCKATLIDVVDSNNWWKEVKKDLAYESNYPVVVLRDGVRFVEHFEAFAFKEIQNNFFGESVVILGGTGNVGLQYAEALLKTTKHKIFLIQRSDIKSIETPITNREHIKAKKIAQLRSFSKNRLFIIKADIGNFDELSSAIATIMETNNGNKIDHIIHAAGIDAAMHYRLLKNVDREFYKTCFYAKKEGLRNLEVISDKFKIKNCHIVSSISSVLGGIGMFVYGGMHSYIDAFVLQQQQKNNDANWSVINWEAWNFGTEDQEPEEFQNGAFGEHLNKLAITPEIGCVLIEKFYEQRIYNLIISSIDLNERYKNWVLNQTNTIEIVENNFNKTSRPDMPTEFVSATTKIEKILLEIWENLLGIEGIGVNDSFFDLGGHSLLVLQMLGSIKKKLGTQLSIVDVFEFFTIKKLSNKIDKHKQQDNTQSNAAITRFTSKKICDMYKRNLEVKS